MNIIEVQTQQDVEKFVKTVPDVVSIDTEYVSGDPRTTKLLSVIVSDGVNAWLIGPSLLSIVSDTLRARKLIFLQDYNHCDTVILYKHGCDIRDCNVYNLIDMHHLLDENVSHSLEDRVLAQYGDNYKAEFWGKHKSVDEADHDERLDYEAKDGVYTYKLGMQDLQQLEKLGLLELYYHVRRKSRALLDTELSGIRVDLALLEKLKVDVEKQINEYLPKLRGEFYDYCKIWELKEWTKKLKGYKTERGKSNSSSPVFSFASDKQISWLVYEALAIPVTDKTKKGSPSTSYETLKSASEEFRGLQTLVEYKELKALYATFIKGMMERVENGRIYPHFNVSGTKTGRISHSDPNMGNLPTDGPIRSMFLADEGFRIIGADYSQLEVLIEANLTHDPPLLKIINEGASKHDITANGLNIDRDKAKTLNFALQYGAGVRKVAKILSIGTEEAQGVFDKYWEIYSGVKNLKDWAAKEVDTKGQIVNAAGRVRRFPTVNKQYEKERQYRQAYNFLIQGAAGYICNEAYSRFHKYLIEHGYGSTLFSVHDEIVAHVREDKAEECKLVLVRIMEELTTDMKFTYPLKAVAYGPFLRWQKT